MFNVKTVTVGVLSMALAFTVGIRSNDSNTYAASGIANATTEDKLELLQNELNRQTAALASCQLESDYDIKVIPFEYDDCEAMFMEFYAEYPYYHYEAEDGSIVVDYTVPNPQEEAAQYCTFIIDAFARQHAND